MLCLKNCGYEWWICLSPHFWRSNGYVDAARDRLHHFNKSLEDTISVDEYLREVHTLRQAIEDGLRHRCFYHYPEEKAEPLL